MLSDAACVQDDVVLVGQMLIRYQLTCKASSPRHWYALGCRTAERVSLRAAWSAALCMLSTGHRLARSWIFPMTATQTGMRQDRYRGLTRRDGTAQAGRRGKTA